MSPKLKKQLTLAAISVLGVGAVAYFMGWFGPKQAQLPAGAEPTPADKVFDLPSAINAVAEGVVTPADLAVSAMKAVAALPDADRKNVSPVTVTQVLMQPGNTETASQVAQRAASSYRVQSAMWQRIASVMRDVKAKEKAGLLPKA